MSSVVAGYQFFHVLPRSGEVSTVVINLRKTRVNESRSACIAVIALAKM